MHQLRRLDHLRQFKRGTLCEVKQPLHMLPGLVRTAEHDLKLFRRGFNECGWLERLEPQPYRAQRRRPRDSHDLEGFDRQADDLADGGKAEFNQLKAYPEHAKNRARRHAERAESHADPAQHGF
ncbi:MAG: hypothetical protein ACTSX8_08510 [Alphaproteobacteria bacterium]